MSDKVRGRWGAHIRVLAVPPDHSEPSYDVRRAVVVEFRDDQGVERMVFLSALSAIRLAHKLTQAAGRIDDEFWESSEVGGTMSPADVGTDKQS